MFKKFISLSLAFMFIFNFCIFSSSAATIEELDYIEKIENINEAKTALNISNDYNLNKYIMSDLEDLSQYNINSANVINIRTNNSHIVYEIDNPAIEDLVILETYFNDDGRVLIFTEGEKTDTVVFKSNGQIILNGNEVIIENNSVMPLAMVYYNSATPVYGYAKDYTTKSAWAISKTSYNNSVFFRGVIISLTISAMSSIITAAFPIGVFGSMSVDLMSTLIQDYALKNAPNETSVYYDDIIEEHDFNSTALYRYYEHNIYYNLKPLGATIPVNSTPYCYYSADIVN